MKDSQKHDHVTVDETSKDKDLLRATDPQEAKFLTTNQGVRISDDQNSLKAGARGPTLLEDFILREKITHFDHERIPERVVHARGAAAHGTFEVYASQSDITSAKFLQDPAVKTPVFVRFSTVAGSRGSGDTVRDVRGFAVKFYTEEGNYDLVGNNIPVFFIQDAIKFPDLIHAVKPEQNNEIPQAGSAHNTFWDFISQTPEAMHMIMWVMSDRAIPRSYQTMEGFGVNTYRFINSEGKARFVKFHWKPMLGVHSLVWDEAQKLAGKDADFNRRALFDAIELGVYPEWEFGVQLIEEEDQLKFGFDVLDPTKLWPEEQFPVRIMGKMTLNRNTDNYFAETEQVAFHVGHVVPGIDFSNDPLLQGRIFSYLDTQLLRIGPNFAQLPINRPLAPVHNNQREGHMQMTVNKGPVAYFPNTLAKGCPMHGGADPRAFKSYAERIDANKIRERSSSFSDHFSQATLFWNSMSEPEKQHIIDALHFELNKVDVKEIRQAIVKLLENVDSELAFKVAMEVGVSATPVDKAKPKSNVQSSPSLSIANLKKSGIKGRKIAILAGDGVNGTQINELKAALKAEGAQADVIGRFGGTIRSAEGKEIDVDKTAITAASVFYDGVFVPGGADCVANLKRQGAAIHFINEAFRHCKPIGAVSEGVDLLHAANLATVKLADSKSKSGLVNDEGVVTTTGSDMDGFVKSFVKALEQHRFFNREKDGVPA